jgi:hypothetical protein
MPKGVEPEHTEMTVETILTTDSYDVAVLNNAAEEGEARVSVLYADGIDKDDAPPWSDRDVAAIAAALSERFGGVWESRPARWDAGDHPTRMESVGTFARVDQ